MSSTPEQRAYWRKQAQLQRDKRAKKEAKKEKAKGVDHISKDAIVYLRHATEEILADLRAHPHKKFKRSELLTFLALSTLE